MRRMGSAPDWSPSSISVLGDDRAHILGHDSTLYAPVAPAGKLYVF